MQDQGRVEESIRKDLNKCAPEIVGKSVWGRFVITRGRN